MVEKKRPVRLVFSPYWQHGFEQVDKSIQLFWQVPTFLVGPQNLDGSWLQLFWTWSKVGWVLVKIWMGPQNLDRPGCNFFGPGQKLDGSWWQLFWRVLIFCQVLKKSKKICEEIANFGNFQKKGQKSHFFKKWPKKSKKTGFFAKKTCYKK